MSHILWVWVQWLEINHNKHATTIKIITLKITLKKKCIPITPPTVTWADHHLSHDCGDTVDNVAHLKWKIMHMVGYCVRLNAQFEIFMFIVKFNQVSIILSNLLTGRWQ